eukprot:CAMPEP_0182884724 /NCGR_PEP_ID=MMETSP0034_2-20130328/19169_1 /TAXON_ID=156128 /ORGANISM="Nephroselmis pyriformis, Strain CCMP717" /LENGTH=320 /DNA_ID=CAMNT_0025017943 /DNA_START=410 /DNA_END=1370 /DNA_ORIENTATION=+
MEELPNAVPAVALNHAQPRVLGHLADGLPDVAEPHARAAHFDALLQALVGAFNQVLGVVIHLPHHEGLVEVRVVAADHQRDVNVHDVPLLEGPLVGDTMADDLVHARAARLGEVVVIEGGGVRPRRHRRLVHHAVDLIRGHAGLDVGVGEVEHLAAQWQAARIFSISAGVRTGALCWKRDCDSSRGYPVLAQSGHSTPAGTVRILPIGYGRSVPVQLQLGMLLTLPPPRSQAYCHSSSFFCLWHFLCSPHAPLKQSWVQKALASLGRPRVRHLGHWSLAGLPQLAQARSSMSHISGKDATSGSRHEEGYGGNWGDVANTG